jgi:group I intron endonuclease
MYTIYYFVDEDGDPFYVGITNNFKRRFRRHISNSRDKNNTLPKYHKFRKVQKLGIAPENIIIPLEQVATESEAIQREIILIAQLRKSSKKCYNLTEGGKGSETFSQKTHKRASSKRKGRKHSIETKRKISESRKGIKFSDEHKIKLSIARKKRITKQSTKEKISKTLKGRVNIKKYKVIDPNGIEYITNNGLTLFCEQHGLTRPNLLQVLSGKRKHHKGWTIERLD